VARQPRSARSAAAAATVVRAPRPSRVSRLRPVVAGALAAAVALTMAACDGGPIAQDTAQSNGQSFVSGSYGTTYYKPGSRPQAPAVTGKTLTGQVFSLAADRGDVVVMNFWGSWCTPCREEAPALGALARHFGSGDVRFIGVDIQDTPSAAEAFMQTYQIGYPSLNDPSDEIALDFRGTLPPTGIPSTLVLDRSGRIAARIVGGVSYSGLKALITEVDGQVS
jgi:thiol-disulfide isomerase/thioredoxin